MQEVTVPGDAPLSDDALCELMQLHFRVDGVQAFAQPPPAAAVDTTRSKAAHKLGAPAPAKSLSLDQFVERTAPLLDLERAAEVGQVI